MKRHPTNPLPGYRGKRKKKASKDTTEEVRSEGSYRKKITKWLCRVETKTIPKQNRITFSSHVEMRTFFNNGRLKSRINIEIITEENILKRISPFQKKCKVMKEGIHLSHLQCKAKEKRKRL